MPTLSQTSTSTSSKTVVALAAVGGLAVAAMVVFGFSIKPKPGSDMLTPGYQVMPETLYRPLGDTPVIEEQKPRPIQPVIKEQDQNVMIKQNVMTAPLVDQKVSAPVKNAPVKK